VTWVLPLCLAVVFVVGICLYLMRGPDGPDGHV
jgi:hypothetical protein